MHLLSHIASSSPALWDAALQTALQARASADTILTRQVIAPRGWFETVTWVSSGLASIMICVLVVFLVPAAWNLRKSYSKINDLLKRVEADIKPIVKHASAIADNVDYVTTSIRGDIQQVSAVIATANDRLNDALAAAEERVQELNALLRVVQEEVEGTFVSTASAVRGVRVGAATFRDGVIDDDGDLDDELAGALDAEEAMHDGNDDGIRDGERESGSTGGVGPRIRSRARRRAE
ncbi:MAG: DUF948 domain-containing protein [Gemmatimonadaceae bacterium]